MSSVIVAMPDQMMLARTLAEHLHAGIGEVEFRRFPDGESYVRSLTDVADRDVIVACSLDDPDPKFLPLHFLASTVRELGARSVGLVAPYLAYMRQDKRFRSGEAITSHHFSALISQTFDWLVTVDPHLHRVDSLDEIYDIRSTVVASAPYVAAWLRREVESPVLVGPDIESDQWVRNVAEIGDLPFVVLEKVRRGDRDVDVSSPVRDELAGRTPVILDDIISSGETMLQTVLHVLEQDLPAPVCIGVHGIFADNAYERLTHHAARVVTCDTIVHESNRIELGEAIAQAVSESVHLKR